MVRLYYIGWIMAQLRSEEKVIMARWTDERHYLFREAARRGLTVEQLRQQLINTIAAEHLCDAVLDDAAEPSAPSSSASWPYRP
jgi:hypothetical protein